MEWSNPQQLPYLEHQFFGGGGHGVVVVGTILHQASGFFCGAFGADDEDWYQRIVRSEVLDQILAGFAGVGDEQ